MAGTLSVKDIWDLVQHILPFYVILLIAYAFAKKNIIQKIHAPGLNRWTSLVGIPLYVGNMLAFNNPYEINLRLVGADALQKVAVLLVACLWWRFSSYGSIDGVITFFMLATLSNMVLVGPALFEPLHGDSSKVSIATIIVLQCALWYNLCIVLFETRAVLKEMHAAKAVLLEEPEEEEAHTIKLPFEEILGVLPGGLDDELAGGRKAPSRLERTTSAPARVSLSTTRGSVRPTTLQFESKLDEEQGDNSLSAWEWKPESVPTKATHGYSPKAEMKAIVQPSSVAVNISGDDKFQEQSNRFPVEAIGMKQARVISMKVLNRVKYAPLTYTSLIGFVYALFAFRYDWDMPYPVRESIQLVADGAIAISVVTMALTWNDTGRVIACGVRKMTYGCVIRFFLGPLSMMICALAFGLTGIAFEFAVLQAALPVGLVSFVLAKEYGLDVEVFSTAVITQLVLFLPLVIAYYYILQPIGV